MIWSFLEINWIKKSLTQYILSDSNCSNTIVLKHYKWLKSILNVVEGIQTVEIYWWSTNGGQLQTSSANKQQRCEKGSARVQSTQSITRLYFILIHFLKPNHFKMQCFSSSFLLTWSKYRVYNGHGVLRRLVPCG